MEVEAAATAPGEKVGERDGAGGDPIVGDPKETAGGPVVIDGKAPAGGSARSERKETSGDPVGTVEKGSAEDLVARCIAPVKKEFLKPKEVRVATERDVDAGQDEKSTKKRERRERKKEFLKHTAATGDGCSKFLLEGHCPFGDRCKFGHDLEGYLKKKMKDLPGCCPFSKAAEKCRFGVTCRWSSTHDGGSMPDFQSDAKSESENEPKKGDCDEKKSDISIPEFVVLNVPAKIEEPINGLKKDLQTKLRKQQYDFSKVDGVLLELGIKISRPGKKRTIRSKGEPPEAPDASVTETPIKKQRIESEGGGSIEKTCTAAHVPLRESEKRRIDFRDKMYLAPLTTLGNLPFRRICVGLGADITCGEMALATNLLKGSPSEWALLKRHPSEKTFGVQVCGGYSDSLSRCAGLIEDGLDVDFVDVNMGCPIDVVCDKGAGASLLQKVSKTEQILKGMSRVLSCPLTIKIRKGYRDRHDIAHTFLPKVGAWGASAVTLHGRSRQQRYSRAADWDYIYKCADVAPDIQLIGNGDVFSPSDWNQHHEKKNVATCMIGRAALVKPWLFTEIGEKRLWDISAGERLDILKDFCSFGMEHWGSDTRGVENTRRFLLEWLSFLHRYIPVGLLEVLPQNIQWRPPPFYGRNDLETLMASDNSTDWIRISEMLLGPPPESFSFTPKHKSSAYVSDIHGEPLEAQHHGQENG
ncbi:hypothetical protein BSKO_05853 [Bryopsis sp. KO-2023]|nr:hypothetical protein BSKO_05853 [Bryopsis sp. KO-2023]